MALDQKNQTQQTRGFIHLALFVLFIVLGIVAKRKFNHPEMVPMFHLPAAVFLVLAGYRLTENSRKAYQADCKKK